MPDAELRALRQELQTDRLAVAQMIMTGFKDLGLKLDEHAESDAKQFQDLAGRVLVVESRTATASKWIYGLAISMFSAFLAWFARS